MSAMSNSVKPIALENVLDPRLECMGYAQNQLKFGVQKSAEYSNWIQQQCNSYSTSGLQWNFNVEETVILDRRVLAECQYKITFTGTAPAGQPLLLGGRDAPRAYPLSTITNSLKATLNGGSTEVQLSDAIQALLHYNNEFETTQYDLSMTPARLDNFQSYADGANSNANPLADYQNSAYELGRGAFQLDSIVNPVCVDGITPVQAVVYFTVTEPLFVSPFLYSADQLDAGLIGVKNMAVSFSFNSGNLSRIWSHAGGAGVVFTQPPLVEIGPNATAPPKLHLNKLTPPLVDIGKVPKDIIYEYNKTDVYVNDLNQSLASGATATFVNNAIQLSTVPKCIYIYASLPPAYRDYTTTDTFFRVNNISLQYLNVSGQFSSMQERDLYQLCLKNGLKMNWNEFHGMSQNLSTGGNVPLCGAVLKIDADDLAIPSNLASGVNVNSQLSYSISLTNVSAQAKNIQLTTVVIYDGLITITEGQMITQVGVVSQQDVLETRMNGSWVAKKTWGSLVGGSFWDKIKSFGRSVISGVKQVLPVVAPAVKALVPESRPVLTALGMGYSEDMMGAGLMGGRKGKGLVGGRKMSRAEMARMLEN